MFFYSIFFRNNIYIVFNKRRKDFFLPFPFIFIFIFIFGSKVFFFFTNDQFFVLEIKGNIFPLSFFNGYSDINTNIVFNKVNGRNNILFNIFPYFYFINFSVFSKYYFSFFYDYFGFSFVSCIQTNFEFTSSNIYKFFFKEKFINIPSDIFYKNNCFNNYYDFPIY
jgi:hypothetical protein